MRKETIGKKSNKNEMGTQGGGNDEQLVQL